MNKLALLLLKLAFLFAIIAATAPVFAQSSGLPARVPGTVGNCVKIGTNNVSTDNGSTCGGGGLYTVDPATVTGIYGLYYADQGAYVDAGVTLATDGQTIQQWNDQSGHGHNLSQATSGLRPTYHTAGGPQGLPNRTTWAATNNLQLPSAAISTFTIFALWRGTFGATAGIFYEQSANAATGSGFVMYTSTNSSITVSRAAALSSREVGPNWGQYGEWELTTHSYGGTHASHHWGINRVTANPLGPTSSSTVSDPGTSTVTDTLNIGSRNGGASFPFTGDIICLVIFTPEISQSNQIGIINFLLNKYNP